jgi:iron(III) transport system permease protein
VGEVPVAGVDAAQANVGLRASERRAFRLSLATLLFSLVLAVVAFLVLGPVLLLLVNSFEVGAVGTPTTWGLENWQTALGEPKIRAALWNTVTLAVARQGIAIVLGVLLAWLIARTDLPGRSWLEFGFWVAVFLPTLTVTLGWIMVFDSFNGLANQLLERLHLVEKGPFDIFSWWGIVWVHLMTGTLPIKVMLLTPAFRNLDASLEEAARMAGASVPRTLWQVVVPVLAPIILVVLVLWTIRALEAFEIELVLGAPAGIDVYSTLIYRRVLDPSPQYGQATVLSSLVLGMLLPLVAFQQWYGGRRSHVTVSGRFQSGVSRLGRWRWPLFAAVFALVLVMTVLPLALVGIGTFMSVFGYFDIPEPWTLAKWQTVLTNSVFRNALVNSLVIASGTALLAMGACAVIAYIVVRTRFVARGVLDFLVWLPSTLPGIVLSLGYLWLFLGMPFLRPIYGTTFILILVAVLGSITLTTQVLKANLLQLGAELEEAAWASGASWWHTMRRVILPLIAPALAVVGVLAFSSSARATSHVALLSTHANQPLSMLQLNLLSDNDFGAASVVGVFILLLTVGVALVARFLGLRIGLGGEAR